MINKAPTSWSDALGDERAADRLWDALDLLRGDNTTAGAPDVDQAWAALSAKLDIAPARPEAKVIPLRPAAGARLSPKRRTWRTWASVAAAAVALLFLVNVFAGWGDQTAEFANDGAAPMKAVLPDKSTILLSPGSELRYEESDNTRSVVMRGEVGFAVRPNTDKPFSVRAEQLDVRVVGTAFTIAEGRDSRVAVTEGHVRVRGTREADWVDLYAGGSATVVDGVVTTAFAKTVEALDLRFRDVQLSEVLAKLSSYHGLSLTAEPHLHTCRITASFEDGTAREAMGTLQLIVGAQIEESPTGIQLVGGSCR